MSFSIDNLQFHKKKFSILLIDWYNKNKRDLPWRKTNDPYKIWLSEIILQQTRISTGIPYYEKFLENLRSARVERYDNKRIHVFIDSTQKKISTIDHLIQKSYFNN